MAKISQLPFLAAPVGDEQVVVVSDGVTKRAAVGSLLAGASVGVVAASSVTITEGEDATNVALACPEAVTFENGSIIEFRAPFDLFGPLTITTEQLGTVNFLNRVASPYTGLAFPAYTTVRAQWNAGGSVWAEYAATTPLYVTQATNISAGAALLGSGLLAGGAVASPIDGNPNKVTVDARNAEDGSLFNVLAVVTNTGPLIMTAGGITRSVANGGGVDLQAGEFEAGMVYPLRYSPGGGKFSTDGAPFPARETATQSDADLAEKPWGNVKISAGGVRTVTAINKYLLLTGSSNAHPDYVSASFLPSNVAVQALNEEYAGTGINWIPDNQAKPGAPCAAIPSQVAASVPYQVGGQVPFHLRFFGMNEIRTIFYASEGGVLQEIDALEASVRADKKRGVTSVLNTIFPPDLRESDTAGDPHWFADTRPFPEGGSTRNQDFPAFKAAPVDPETQMEPRASQMLTGPRDWTGSGDPTKFRQGYKRVQHWNELVRALGAKLDVMVLDFEWSAYRNAIETVPDLGAGLNQFYTPGNPLHPKDALYAAAVTPILRQWAKIVRSGRQDVRLLRGQDDGALGATVANLANTLAGALTDLSYRPTLASAVADFDVGTFFTSRDMDGVSAYPGVKRQYQIISAAPYWADRGPWSDPADLGLGNVDNTRDVDKPLSAAMGVFGFTAASVSGTRFKLALRGRGHLRPFMNELASQIDDPDYEASIMFQHGDPVAPDGIVAALVQTKLALTDAEMTAIFADASS